MKKIILIGILFFYAVLISTNTNGYSPLDDTKALLSFEDGQLPSQPRDNGRFIFTQGLDLFLLEKVNPMKGSSTIDYIWFAFIFILTATFFYKTIKSYDLNIVIWLSILILIMFSPAFTSIYFRLLYQEKYSLLWFVLLSYQFINLDYKNNILKLVSIIILAFLLIFTKEPGIVAMLFLSIGLFLKYVKDKIYKDFLLGFVLFLISCFVIISYFLYTKTIKHRYGDTEMSFMLNLVKSIGEWTIADPVLFLVFLPLFGHRIYLVARKRESIDYADILAFSGIGYMFSFLISGMYYGEHYMTPVYGVALIFIGIRLRDFEFSKKLKLVVVLIILLQVSNSIIGINDIIFQKYNNRNFKNSILFLKKIKNSNVDSVYISGGVHWDTHFKYTFQYWMDKESIDMKLINIDTMNTHIGMKVNFLITPYSSKRIDIPTYFKIGAPGGLGKGYVLEDIVRNIVVEYNLKSFDKSNTLIIRSSGIMVAEYSFHSLEGYKRLVSN